MALRTDNLNNFCSDIKTTCLKRGAPDPGLINPKNLDSVIDSIPAGECGGITESFDFGEFELPLELQTGTRYYKAHNGKVYISSNITDSGLWQFNRETRTFRKLLDYYNWRWFHSYGVHLFVATDISNANYNGFWKLNENEDGFDRLYNTGYKYDISHIHNNKIYFNGSNTAGQYVFQYNFNTKTFSRVFYSTGSGYYGYFGSAVLNNRFYIFGNGGILQLNETETTFVSLTLTNYGQYHFIFESKLYIYGATTVVRLNDTENGVIDAYSERIASITPTPSNVVINERGIFMSGTSTGLSGLAILKSGTVEFRKIIESGYSLLSIIYFNKNFYVGADTSLQGVFKINYETLETIRIDSASTTITYFSNFHIFNNRLYGNSSSSTAGRQGLKVLNETEDSFEELPAVYSSGYNWINWFEYNGEQYVSSSGSYLILKLNPDGLSVTTIGSSQTNWVQVSVGSRYVTPSSGVSTSRGFPFFDLQENKVVHTLGQNWKEIDDVFYSTRNETLSIILNKEFKAVGVGAGIPYKGYFINSVAFVNSIKGKVFTSLNMPTSFSAMIFDEQDNMCLPTGNTIIVNL